MTEGPRFISESSLNELRELRQSEWEKVRKAEDPIGEKEIYFPRSLRHTYLYILLILRVSCRGSLYEVTVSTAEGGPG